MTRAAKITIACGLLGIPGILLLGSWLFLFKTYNIPSASNEPTLKVGDYILVSKLAYRNADPQRGDMAVFKLPRDTSIDYIKRVMGLPGDRIQMKAGIVYLNGEALPQTASDTALSWEGQKLDVFRETLPNGKSYLVANMTNGGIVDNTEEYVVPAGHYFMMGDSRDNSQDSRFLDQTGYIPRENFVGRYEFTIFNFKRFW